MDCSTPDFPVHHQLLELTQTHVHRVGNAIQPSHPLSAPSLPSFNLSQHQCPFQMSQFFTSGGQIGVSASASVLPMNIQDWFSRVMLIGSGAFCCLFCTVRDSSTDKAEFEENLTSVWIRWSFLLLFVFLHKRPWRWERLKAGREGDDRGWDGWMSSPTQWT